MRHSRSSSCDSFFGVPCFPCRPLGRVLLDNADFLCSRVAFLNLISLNQLGSNHTVLSRDEVDMTQLAQTPVSTSEPTEQFEFPRARRKRQRSSREKSSISAHGPLLISKNSWLSKLGVSGSVGFYATGKFLNQSIWLSFGFRLPFDLLSKIVSFELITCHLGSQLSDIQISSGRIRLRNMVSSGSPFFRACEKLDLHQVRWHLMNGTANVNDVDPEGKTPLHVSFPRQSQIFS